MAADRLPRALALLLVPIVMALLAAAVVTVRGCHADRGGAARETGRRGTEGARSTQY